MQPVTPAQKLRLFGRRGQSPPAPGLDTNWWQRFQFAGNNPTIVLDFANGLYWDGTSTTTDPTAFVNNGTVTAGSGLLCNATNITAKGALLSAFQGGSGYNAQIATFGAPAAAGANVGMLSDNNVNGVFMNGSSAGFLTFNNGASSGLQDFTSFTVADLRAGEVAIPPKTIGAGERGRRDDPIDEDDILQNCELGDVALKRKAAVPRTKEDCRRAAIAVGVSEVSPSRAGRARTGSDG